MKEVYVSSQTNGLKCRVSMVLVHLLLTTCALCHVSDACHEAQSQCPAGYFCDGDVDECVLCSSVCDHRVQQQHPVTATANQTFNQPTTLPQPCTTICSGNQSVEVLSQFYTVRPLHINTRFFFGCLAFVLCFFVMAAVRQTCAALEERFAPVGHAADDTLHILEEEEGPGIEQAYEVMQRGHASGDGSACRGLPEGQQALTQAEAKPLPLYGTTSAYLH